nr:xylulose kinase-1 [Tanacetum cinerariifolium]
GVTDWLSEPRLLRTSFRHCDCVTYECAGNLVDSELMLDHDLLDRSEKDCPTIKTSPPSYPSSNTTYNKPKFHANSSSSQQHNQNADNNQKRLHGKYKALKAELAFLTKKIDVVLKNKSEKRLVAESFDWDEESLSFEDEGVTRVKAFMAIVEDEPAVGKIEAMSSKWVEITMKKDYLKIYNGNSKKSIGRDSKGGIIILPSVSFEEHVAGQRETKARTLLLQSLLEDHMADFHHLDDAREIWLAVKARFGGNEESKKMRKTMHEAENKTEEGEQVYGLMAGFKSDFTDHAGNAAGSVSDVAAKFAMMGISSKGKIEKTEWEVKHVESLARFDKWKESSKNLVKLINSSMYSRIKLGLGFKETIGSDEVFDLSTPSVFDPETDNREVKSLYERDKSSESETYDFASCVSNPRTNDSFSTVDVKILPKSDVKDPNPTNGFPSCSFKENVKPPRNLYNFPSVVSKAASVPAGSRNSSASISAGRSIPAASRNRPASIHTGRHILAGRFNRPAPFLAGRSVPTGKDISNPFMAMMVCQKPLGYFSSPMIHVPRAGLVIHLPGPDAAVP